MAAEAPQATAPALPPRIVLFDGVCVICNATARFLLRRDPSARLHYAPLQGEVAAALRARHPEIPEELETVIYVDASDGTERVHMNARGVLRTLREIDGPWRFLSLLARLPTWLLDPPYLLFVRNRYRLFGRYDECPVPTPEERSRFLD